MLAFLANLKHLGETLSVKSDPEKNAFMASAICLSGLMASILCFLADFLYYLNRNELLFVYLENTAFPLGFLFCNALLHQLTAQCYPVATSIKLNLSPSSSATLKGKM